MDQTRIDQAKREINELTGPYGDGNVDTLKKILDEFPFLINEVISPFSGHTILASASFRHHVRIVEYLVSRPDLDVNLGPWSALHYAANEGHIIIVGILLTHPHIDVNIKTPDGRTPADLISSKSSLRSHTSNRPIILEMLEAREKSSGPFIPYNYTNIHSKEV
eukprot:gene19433-22960_t